MLIWTLAPTQMRKSGPLRLPQTQTCVPAFCFLEYPCSTSAAWRYQSRSGNKASNSKISEANNIFLYNYKKTLIYLWKMLLIEWNILLLNGKNFIHIQKTWKHDCLNLDSWVLTSLDSSVCGTSIIYNIHLYMQLTTQNMYFYHITQNIKECQFVLHNLPPE